MQILNLFTSIRHRGSERNRTSECRKGNVAFRYIIECKYKEDNETKHQRITRLIKAVELDIPMQVDF